MIRHLSRALRGTALAFVLLSFITAPAFAQTIYFPGTTLQSWPGWDAALAPSGSATGKSATLSNNRVTL